MTLEPVDFTERDWIAYAKAYEGACWSKGEAGFAHTDDLNWFIVNDYPVARIFDAPDKTWFDEERDFAEKDGRKGYYDDMLDEEIVEPIIVFDDGQHGYIWDGWHRTGATIVLGKTTIKALVGMKK